MINWSNTDILRLLQQQPGRLREFLLEVPMADLQAAVQQRHLAEDLRVRALRERFAYRKNVLDLTLDVVINLCYQQNIFNFFQRQLGHQQSRIQNHPYYGHKLVNKCPEKYYIGQRSRHYNRSRQIEEAYGIFRDRAPQNEPKQDNVSPQENEDLSNFIQEDQEDDQEDDQEADQEDQDEENQQEPNNDGQENYNSMNEYDDDQFVVEDESDADFLAEDQLSEDSVEEKIRNSKKAIRVKKQVYSEEKVELTDKTTSKKLKKSILQTRDDIKFDQYMIDPNHPEKIPTSKKNQKIIKQQLKRLQTSLPTNPQKEQANLPKQDTQIFAVTRKTRKMDVKLD